MKRLVTIAAMFLTVAGLCRGGALEDNCGCGLGSMVFQGRDALVSQTCAATTNGIFLNQVFGISSGTLGCDQPATLVTLERMNVFVAANMDNLARDIAVGKGETLETLAELMAVPKDQRVAVYAKLRSNFATIYSEDSISHKAVSRNILRVTRS